MYLARIVPEMFDRIKENDERIQENSRATEVVKRKRRRCNVIISGLEI